MNFESNFYSSLSINIEWQDGFNIVKKFAYVFRFHVEGGYSWRGELFCTLESLAWTTTTYKAKPNKTSDVFLREKEHTHV